MRQSRLTVPVGTVLSPEEIQEWVVSASTELEPRNQQYKRYGVVVKYSEVSNTVAIQSPILKYKNELFQYFTNYQQLLADQLLRDPVLILLSPLNEQQLIMWNNRSLSVLKNLYDLWLGDELLQGASMKVIDYLQAVRSKWLKQGKIFYPPVSPGHSRSGKYLNKLGYKVYPPLQDISSQDTFNLDALCALALQRRSRDLNIFPPQQSTLLLRAVAENPQYCKLIVKSPQLLPYTYWSCKLLATEEKRIISDTIKELSLGELQKMVVSLDTFQGTQFLNNKFQVISPQPLNPQAEAIRLLDYFADWPLSQVNLEGCLVTGECISACTHSIRSDLTPEKMIDFYYPPFLTKHRPKKGDTRETFHGELMSISKISGITEDYENTYLLTDQGNLRISISSSNPIIIVIPNNAPVPRLESETGTFYERQSKLKRDIIAAVSSHYPEVRDVKENTRWRSGQTRYVLLVGIRRHITIITLPVNFVLEAEISINRGYFTGSSSGLKVFLSWTSVYSALHRKNYDYSFDSTFVDSKGLIIKIGQRATMCQLESDPLMI